MYTSSGKVTGSEARRTLVVLAQECMVLSVMYAGLSAWYVQSCTWFIHTVDVLKHTHPDRL